MLNVIDDNRTATGVSYETNEPKFHMHHNKYNQECVWLDRVLEEGEQLSDKEYDGAIAYLVKQKRDKMIDEIGKRFQRYDSEVRQGISPTTDDIGNLDQIAQQLRDIPEQDGFPHDVIFPDIGE
jgi:hypothetical protein